MKKSRFELARGAINLLGVSRGVIFVVFGRLCPRAGVSSYSYPSGDPWHIPASFQGGDVCRVGEYAGER